MEEVNLQDYLNDIFDGLHDTRTPQEIAFDNLMTTVDTPPYSPSPPKKRTRRVKKQPVSIRYHIQTKC